MSKPLSDRLFVFESHGSPAPILERCSARDLNLKESWFRDAIFAAPELVIGPCRAAGATEDEWYAWAREYPVEVGKIDVLLVSSQGRVAIVETKLATSPELRRRVLAQALDYLTHLPDALELSMPKLPEDDNGEPVADVDDIRESVAQGDLLVIVVSDEIDPRAVRLSRSLIADNLVKQWDLVLVDLALYRDPTDVDRKCVIVPHVRSLVLSEPRQVVRVVVEGEKPSARVVVQRVVGDEVAPGRQKWDEARFFETLEAKTVPSPVRELAAKLRTLASNSRGSIGLVWGTGRQGSMVVKRNGLGLIEIHGSGQIRFRPHKFVGALGEKVASEYRRALESLAPEAMRTQYPRLSSAEAAPVAPALYDLIERVLAQVNYSVEG